MNSFNSDHPGKPLSADSLVSTPFETNRHPTQTSEALLRLKDAAMEAAMDGIALLENGRYLYLNSQHLRIFGYNHLQELIGQPWQVLYEPQEANRLQQQVIPILESVGHWHGETIAKRKDHSTFVLEISLTYTQDKILICVCRDISARKQAEQQRDHLLKQLRRTNTILQAQQAASLEGFLMIDNNGKVISHNPKLCQLWNIPPDLTAPGKDQELLQYIADQTASPKALITQMKKFIKHLDIRKHDEVKLKDGRTFEYYLAPLQSSTEGCYGRILSFRDISEQQAALRERKKIEANLQESYNLLNGVINSTTDLIFTKNIQGQYLLVNKAFSESFGQAVEELMGKTDEDIFPPEIVKQVQASERLILQGGKPRTYEEVVTIQGELQTFLTTKTAYRDAEGEIVGIVGITRNISDRKAIEDQLRVSEQRLSLFVQQTPLAVIEWNINFQVIAWNPAAEKIFGYTASEALQQSVEFLVPESERDSVSDIIADLLSHKKPSHNINQNLTKEGHLITCQWYNTPLLTPEGELVGVASMAIDITDLKRTEQELKNQKAFLQSIWDNVNYVIFVVDVINQGEDFRFVSFNPASITTFSQGINNLIGKTIKQVFSEEMVQAFLPRYAEVVHSGKSISFEERFVNEQEVTWWFMTLAPLKDPQGKVYQVVGTSENVTERKCTEDKLRIQQNQIKYLLNNIPHMAWLKNKQGQFIAVNEPLSRQFNLVPEQMIGRVDAEFFTGELARKILKDDQENTTSDRPRLTEKKIIDSDGKVSWIEIYKTSIISEQEQVLGTVGIAVEITERKRTEYYLRQQARREKILNQLTTQIRNSLDFETILKTTLASVKDCLSLDRCTFCVYYPHADQPYLEVIQESHNPDLPSFQGEQFLEHLVAPMAERALNGKITKIVDANLEKNRAFKQVLKVTQTQSFVSIPLPEYLGKIGLLTCSTHYEQTRNWTDEEISLLEAVVEQLAIALKQAELYEQTRTKAQELEQAMQELRRTQAQMIQNEKMSSLGQLVAGVAHEINNPASFIYGNLSHAQSYANDLFKLIELYQTHYPEPHPEIIAEITEIDLEFLREDLPKLINSIQNGAERIKKIVESLRTFSRLDEAELKTIDIHEGINSTLMILESRLHKNLNPPAIAVIKEYSDLPPVECYAGQLNQVFINILSNAIDALEESMKKLTNNNQTFEHPYIKIRTKLTADHQVMIAIFNNGFGIPKNIKERIFDPFFTTKPVGKGTGMGLSICYQIITEKHQGSIECFSEPKQGTEFVICIPLSIRQRS